MLKYCENKPEITVDRGSGTGLYKDLRLKYQHETFGERNAVEGFFSPEKKNRFPLKALSNPFKVGLESFVGLYNFEVLS